MSKTKRVVGVVTLLVSFLVMAVPALGQQREKTNQRKRKGTSVTSTTAVAVPLVLLRKKDRGKSSEMAVSPLQAPSARFDTQRVSAGLTGVKGLSTPTAPTSSTKPPTGTSLKTLSAPTTAIRIQ